MISGLDCTQRDVEYGRDFLKRIVVKKAEDHHRSLFISQFLDGLRYHLVRAVHQHRRLIPMRLFPREGTDAFKNSESPPALDPKSLHLTDDQAVQPETERSITIVIGKRRPHLHINLIHDIFPILLMIYQKGNGSIDVLIGGIIHRMKRLLITVFHLLE